MSVSFSRHNLFKNDFIIAALLLIIFFLTNGYTLGWDDQHLEIPMLKSLIDPGLYAGDYYVESLKQNFVSVLYPLLARIISIKMIPAVFLSLFIVSRYFLFFWIYKIWSFLSKDRLTGFACALTFIVLGRIEEFLYRTFSHQELALAVIFAGIYFFYRERFVLAAALLGVAANIHVLYSFFPFFYLCVYLVLWHKQDKLKQLMKALGAFVICSLPVLIWIIRRGFAGQGGGPAPTLEEWTTLYKIACPQNFLFYTETLNSLFRSLPVFIERTVEYWFLLLLSVAHFCFTPQFREDKKSRAVLLGGTLMLAVSFVFTYVIPSRFVLDLNLVRNTQYMLFVLIGYLPVLIVTSARRRPVFPAVGAALCFTLLRFGTLISALAVLVLLGLLAVQTILERRPLKSRHFIFLSFWSAFVLAVLSAIVFLFNKANFASHVLFSLGIAVLLIVAVFVLWGYLKRKGLKADMGKWLVLVPLVIYTVNYSYYHYRRRQIENHGGGFWQMQRNWIDMQKFVRDNTPRDALILVPHDMEMGGFRIFSEREIVCSYRDCGIIGFDYGAAKEWQTRLDDIEAFKVYMDGPVTKALLTAILKYKVNYIVFMAYFNPGDNPVLQERYRNEVFTLYQVMSNPVGPR